jgi:hypothetical protein
MSPLKVDADLRLVPQVVRDHAVHVGQSDGGVLLRDLLGGRASVEGTDDGGERDRKGSWSKGRSEYYAYYYCRPGCRAVKVKESVLQIGTAVTAPPFNYLRGIDTGNEGLVDLTGIEPVTS